MKITPMPATGTIQAYSDVKRKNSVTLSGFMGRDQVEFSGDAKILSAALQMVKETPGVREALIAEIKEKIENGTYSVESRQIAKKIMQSAALDGISK